MAACFLFAQTLTETGCFSLRLNNQHEIESELRERSFDEIVRLQHQAKTFLVISTTKASLHTLPLPALSTKKLQAIIPYALEEQVAADIDTLHFAFDKRFEDKGHYLIVVIDKAYLQSLIHLFETNHILLDSITLDWFALKNHEAAITEQSIIIHHDSINGALSEDLISLVNSPPPLFHFTNSLSLSQSFITINKNEPFELFFAKRLATQNAINLLQGIINIKKPNYKKQRYLFTLTIISVVFWIASYLITHVILLMDLHKKNNALDTNIAAIYTQYFPEAKQVITPRFRLAQWLKSKGHNGDDSMWQLFNALASSISLETTTLSSAIFQKNTLMITLKMDDFNALEQLQNTLSQNHINVKQQEAITEGKKIKATLELSL